MADRIVRTVEIFWDDQNSTDEGWAYRVNFAGGHEESGPADGESDDGISTLSSVVAGYLPEDCDAAALRWKEMQGAKGWTARVTPDEAPRPLDYYRDYTIGDEGA